MCVSTESAKSPALIGKVMRFASREEGTHLLNDLYDRMAKSFEILAE